LNSARFKLRPSNSANPNQPPRALLTPVKRSLAFMVVTLTGGMKMETFEVSITDLSAHLSFLQSKVAGRNPKGNLCKRRFFCRVLCFEFLNWLWLGIFIF
jgi:hypothetical protein